MLNLLGQEINENYRGMVIITYVDGSIEKIIK
jgi:acetylglutamate synthase